MINDSSTSALLTDLYQITMAQAYYKSNKHNVSACFNLMFRDYPFKGGYAVCCGVAQVAEYIKDFKFTEDQIDYLFSLKASNGKKLFEKDFLSYLKNLELDVDIVCAPEGSIVFPHEPILRVTGPILQCQLIETPILNALNFQTLVATKASRICSAAQCPVSEFGLRRAQGFAGATWASRAACVGGCSSTSNVEAGKVFDLPVSGTHSHSWVMTFDNELESFRAYAKAFPHNCILLVDTYNIEEGIKNAITVGQELKQIGEKLTAIRIDSGDLTWLSKKARDMLDQAGLEDCGIILSNDLDEYSIKSIRAEGGVFTGLGIGTKLATAYDQPALGGVYKLSAICEDGSNWIPKIKVSETQEKTTYPGVLNVRRYIDNNNKLAGDMIYDVNNQPADEQVIVDPFDFVRQKDLSAGSLEHYDLLVPLVENGKVVQEDFSYLTAQERMKKGLSCLDETQTRTLNPHTYPVGLEYCLYKLRQDMVITLKGIN